MIGMIISTFFYLGYKLNDKDVQIMAKCNSGEITREEAEKLLAEGKLTAFAKVAKALSEHWLSKTPLTEAGQMLADFVLLDKNPFEEFASNIRKISVLETYLAGKKVFCKS